MKAILNVQQAHEKLGDVEEDDRPQFTIPYEYKGIQYPGVVLRSSIDAMESFEVRPDDVFVLTFPKSGSHWLMEISGLVLTGGYPEKINRSTWGCMEMINIHAVKLPQTRAEELTNPVTPSPLLDEIKRAPSPRIMNSHLQFKYLPPNLHKRAKIIYVARNPKDVVNSYYNFLGDTRAFQNKSFDQVVEDFMEGDNFRYGSWFDHVMDAWKIRDEENVLFLFYEEVKKNPMKYIKQVADFLGRPLSEEVQQRILEQSSFEGMAQTYKKLADDAIKSGKSDPTRIDGKRGFMKKGTSGQWKTRFTVARNEAFDRWYREKFIGTALRFKFE
ncbi:sulfotransferase 1A3-like [Lytechinus variegatus]|uniref:sulfotransferase 1A3-like n=1 Tax=Lytechinus variegatus TaxID=7654 RepID=UPI001BB174C3|nr:sulfotransferase 1A3-like [Lytechinus variegatus]